VGVLAASIYPKRAAATRLRLNPVLLELGRRGVPTHLWTFLNDADLATWIAGGSSRIGPACRGLLGLGTGLREAETCDLMLLQREALPLNSLLMEKRVLSRDRPLIWDVDDALWTSALGAGALIRGTSKKYEWLAREASEVWAGNTHVADWASSAGARVVRLVPTTVPVPPVIHNDHREDDLLTWVGTPSTGPYVERLLHDLRDSLGEWRVHIVGARIEAPGELKVTQCDWSPAAEADALSRASVGLYPLDIRHPATIGKSALKSVLFMAHGIPLIATPTPSNLNVMTHGREGFFASSKTEWCEYLGVLRDQQERRVMGARGHQHAMANYDSGTWGAELCQTVIKLMSS
jgi:hypothetical protein